MSSFFSSKSMAATIAQPAPKPEQQAPESKQLESRSQEQAAVAEAAGSTHSDNERDLLGRGDQAKTRRKSFFKGLLGE